MSRPRVLIALLGLVILVVAYHWLNYHPSDPFFNGDEQRHVMTGVFFHDFFRALPLGRMQEYAISYYMQYPSLGLLFFPPLFYVVEGTCMLLLGTSVAVAKGLVVFFCLIAAIYLFGLVSRSHGSCVGFLTAALFCTLPLITTYSRQVMLELPALAFCLGMVYHFVKYLDQRRRRDLAAAALFAVATLLTRYDGILVFPLLLLVLVLRGDVRLLKSRPLLLALLLTLILAAPYYALAAKQIGWVHLRSTQVATSPYSGGFFSGKNYIYYPLVLPRQLGVPALAVAVFGLIGALAGLRKRGRLRALAPYFALVLATYLSFSPVAELESRHAIYWLPAFAFFAILGCEWLGRLVRVRWLSAVLGLLLVGIGAAHGATRPRPYVLGTEEAARYVVERTAGTPFCLVGLYLDGSFIYHLRRLDPERRMWTLRSDKILYSAVAGNRQLGYAEFVKSKQEIVDLIHRYDPEYIVVEEPPVALGFPVADLLRATLRERTDLYRLENTVKLQTNVRMYTDVSILMYRKLERNSTPERALKISMLPLGHTLEVGVPEPPGLTGTSPSR